MAEGANVRQNLQNLPSIFEINAAETLDNLIYPALNRIFEHFNLRLDFKLWGHLRIREEPSVFITWLLQYLYLKQRGSSFGESFYGLQRTNVKTGDLLTAQQRLISAGILTFLPYIEKKLKTRSAQHEDTTKWEKYVLKSIYIFNTAKALHTFLYLLKYATSHSPIFRALGLMLRYPIEPQKEDKATYMFIKLLEVFAFFLQFIQWWYSNEQRPKVGWDLKNPEPMNLDEEILGVDGKLQYNIGDCPICLMKIETPTACAISGYVYCWKCIIAHLKKDPRCPMTNYPITLDNLVRIYDT